MWARSAGVTTDAAQAAAQMAYVINTPPPAPVTSATLTSNVASPQNTGTTITLTATAQGGVAPYQFKYYLSTDGGRVGHLDLVAGLRRQDLDPAAGLRLSRQGVGAQRGCHDRCGAGRGAAGVCDQHTAARGGDERHPWCQSGQPAEHGHGCDLHGRRGRRRQSGAVQVLRAARRRRSADGAGLERDDELRLDAEHGDQLHDHRVGAQRGSHGRWAPGTAQLAYVINTPPPAPVTSATLTSNVASPQNTGTTITLTATAQGGVAPYQFKDYLSTDGGLTWGIWTAWQASGVKTWTPPQACDCRVKVWARSAGVTTDAAQAEAQLAYVINTPPPAAVTSATLGASLASPQNTGTAVTFTAGAAGGVNPVQYKFFVQHEGGVAQMVRDWSATTSYAWMPSTATNYTITRVGAQRGSHGRRAPGISAAGVCDQHTAAGAGDERDADVQCREPAEHGHDDHAHGDGAGWRRPVPVQVPYLSTDGGLTWGIWTAWQASGVKTWTPPQACDCRVKVWARSAGVTTDAAQAEAQLAYVINTPPPAAVTSASLTPSVASPQNAGTAVTFTAGAAGGVDPLQYKFFVQQGGGVAQMVRDWSATTSYAWTPSTAASYTVTVWARSAGVTTDAPQAAAQLAYVINTPPVTSATLTSNVASPQNTGTTITLTATAQGGVAPYQFTVLPLDRRRSDVGHLDRVAGLRRQDLDPAAGLRLSRQGVGAQRGCHDRCGAGRGAAGVCDQHTAARGGDERHPWCQSGQPAEHGHGCDLHGRRGRRRQSGAVQVLRAARAAA